MQETNPGAPTVTITLTAEDLKQAYWLIQTKATVTPGGFLRLFFLALLTLTATAIALLAVDGEVKWPLAIIAAIAGPCGMVASVYYRNAKMAKRIYGQQKSLHLPFTLTWTDEHVITNSTQGRAVLAWGDLTKVEENKKLILLFESDAIFRIIPRAALTAEQQQDVLARATAGLAQTPAS